VSLARTRCTPSIMRARRVLRLAGVRSAEDIEMDLIAADYGLCSIPKRLPDHEGNLVRLGDSGRGLVAIDEALFGTPWGRFILAHELGHHLLHEGHDLALACSALTGPTARGDYYRREREADVFAVELVLPEALFGPLVGDAAPTLDRLRVLADGFRTSLAATALRAIDFAVAPCAAVLSHRGLVVKHAATEAFPLTLVRGFALGPEAIAGGDGATRAPASSVCRAKRPRASHVTAASSPVAADGFVVTLLTAD
jgi:Zn-dependent peptidase ImmA (M78 family)